MKLRHLLLIFAALLVAIPALSGINVKRGPHNPVITYNVLEFGAVADAVEASTCDSGEPIPMDCDVAGSGTNNAAAISAAVAAAVAAGGGEVYIPAGKYRIGSGAGAGYTSGQLILVQGDNVTIRGDGDSTVLLPGHTDGGIIIGVCNNVVAGACSSPTAVYNFAVKDLMIRDDDPHLHGCTYCASLEVESISAAFTFGEVLNFTGGETAEFFWQSADTGTGRFIYMYPNGDVIDASDVGDTITGATSGSTADITSIVTTPQSEETHGVALNACYNCDVDVDIDDIGDEGVLTNNDCYDVRIHDSHFRNVPSLPSLGSAIDIARANHVTVSGNTIELGVGATVAGSNKGIEVAAGATDTTDITISGNTLVEAYDNLTDHNVAEVGIYAVYGTTTDVIGLNITGNIVELDIDAATDLTCTATSDCAAIIVLDGAGGNVVDATIANNTVTGAIYARVDGAIGAVVSANSVVGTYQDGISVAGNNVSVVGNNISGHSGSGIVLFGNSTGNTSISGNVISDVGDGLTGNKGVIYVAASTYAENLLISNNVIDGKASAGAVSGIRCGSVVGSTAIGNFIKNADDSGIVTCKNAIDNTIWSPTGRGIYAAGILNVVSGNKIYDSTLSAIAGTSAAFLICEENQSISLDTADYIVIEPTGLVGTPVIGDRVEWNGAAENGTVVGYSAGVSITIIPDSVATDVIASGVDDPQLVGGAGWTTTNVVVTHGATAAADIVCDTIGGGTENDNMRIPAP